MNASIESKPIHSRNTHIFFYFLFQQSKSTVSFDDKIPKQRNEIKLGMPIHMECRQR